MEYSKELWSVDYEGRYTLHWHMHLVRTGNKAELRA